MVIIIILIIIIIMIIIIKNKQMLTLKCVNEMLITKPHFGMCHSTDHEHYASSTKIIILKIANIKTS